MSLPKEPRQKMINIMYLVLTAILAINVSNEVIVAFKTVDASLVNSTNNIGGTNTKMLDNLQKEKNNEETKDQANIWQPRAEQAKILSEKLQVYIDSLKAEVKQGAGLVMKDGQEHYVEDNLNSSTNLFENQGKGAELKARLYAYKAQLLAIDTAIGKEFATTLPLDIEPPVGDDGKQRDFNRAYFHMTPAVAAITVLSKFQNNIANSENKVVAFCQREIGEVQVHLDKTAVLVSSSADYVMPGDKLVISAGIGAYSSTASPIVSIDGSSVPVSDGLATHEITASGGGAHTVHVNVAFKDEHGKLQNQAKEVTYTVGTPGGSAVMLDKMNVFYIGVDNPVTIGSPTGWDKTQVSITGGGGSITPGASSRVVRVSKVENVTINVVANGKPTPFEFRVKRIPDPVFKIASGKPRMPSVEFKNQQYCRADLENFDFALKYNIVSATVYFSGANFPNVQTASITGNSLAPLDAYVKRCGPGSVVTFDNIKISGPDGERTIDGKSFALY